MEEREEQLSCWEGVQWTRVVRALHWDKPLSASPSWWCQIVVFTPSRAQMSNIITLFMNFSKKRKRQTYKHVNRQINSDVSELPFLCTRSYSYLCYLSQLWRHSISPSATFETGQNSRAVSGTEIWSLCEPPILCDGRGAVWVINGAKPWRLITSRPSPSTLLTLCHWVCVCCVFGCRCLDSSWVETKWREEDLSHWLIDLSSTFSMIC